MKRIKLILAILAFAVAVPACKTTPTNPDTFYQRVVTCTLANTQNQQAGAAVLKCLTDAVGGNYTACLAGLVTAGTWTVDEIACIVRSYATNAAAGINKGMQSDEDRAVLNNANAWIRDQQLLFRSAP